MREEFKLRKLYWIEWIDSSSTNGWAFEERACDNDLRCWTVGFFVGEDDEAVTVAGSCSAHGALLDPITIPWVAVTKIQEGPW